VHAGAPLRLRLHGRFADHGSRVLDAAEAETLVLGLLSAEDRALLDARGELDFVHTMDGVARFRANVYRQQRGLDAVLRVIPLEPPSLAALGLPQALARFTNYHQGMVLVTGPAGCGKSSTLAALVNLINEERREHVLTIEDPIEYVHASKRCLVNQRNVRRHTESFARALRAGLREDPDVIVIGELRDIETISLALTAAETGHFVLASLHTNDTIRTVNRLVGAFPSDQQDQVRTMISESLRAVISQRLLSAASGAGRLPALEVLINNKAVGNLIRENKTIQIRSALQTGIAQGMVAFDQSLAQLVQQGLVTREEALRHCEDPRKLEGGAGGGAHAEAR
jgi:twitching motility protein PilT